MTAWDYLLPKPKPAQLADEGTWTVSAADLCWSEMRLGTLNSVECRPVDAVVLSADEARELEKFTAHTYINPNDYPALYALVRRLAS